jgi:hypothetical protein
MRQSHAEAPACGISSRRTELKDNLDNGISFTGSRVNPAQIVAATSFDAFRASAAHFSVPPVRDEGEQRSTRPMASQLNQDKLMELQQLRMLQSQGYAR